MPLPIIKKDKKKTYLKSCLVSTCHPTWTTNAPSHWSVKLDHLFVERFIYNAAQLFFQKNFQITPYVMGGEVFLGVFLNFFLKKRPTTHGLRERPPTHPSLGFALECGSC
ncbi:hypothetical protein HanIR_Chr09g0445591 [Helianthus annuus]|nr:hypothetical protein HanIR_Chr09g0445591 [Helianthus annuus]